LSSIGPTQGNGATIAVEVTGEDSVEAAMSPDALKQVLLNLLQNSRDAKTVAGPAQIGITVSAHGAQVSVDVVDDGPGIAPDILHRVFDPFFTTKDAVHGVGL